MTQVPTGKFEKVDLDVGVHLAGWLFRTERPRRGLLVYLHGLGDNRSSGISIAQHFNALGFDVLAYDSRAHGESGGDACTYGFYEKTDLSRAIDKFGGGPIVAFGVSLGAGIALQAAADDPRIALVVAVAPISDLRTAAAERAPFFASRANIDEAFRIAEKEAAFRADDVNPAASAARIHAPVLVIHGADDRRDAAGPFGTRLRGAGRTEEARPGARGPSQRRAHGRRLEADRRLDRLPLAAPRNFERRRRGRSPRRGSRCRLRVVFRFFVTCARGTEGALRREIAAMRIAGAKGDFGGVWFEGPLEMGMRVCLHSRVGVRVLAQLGTFEATEPKSLYAGARAIPWQDWLTSTSTFAVHASVRDTKELSHSGYVALKVKDAVADSLRDAFGERPNVDPKSPDVGIVLHLAAGKAGIFLDLAGESLHRRGYRVAMVDAPLKEALAAAVLILGGAHADQPFIDPMCGSGTLAIEHALAMRGSRPGCAAGSGSSAGRRWRRSLWPPGRACAPRPRRPPWRRCARPGRRSSAPTLIRSR